MCIFDTNNIAIKKQKLKMNSKANLLLSFMLFSTIAFSQQYNLDNNVVLLTNQTCPLNIEKIEQSPSGTYNGGKCFMYDSAGNLSGNLACKFVILKSELEKRNLLSNDELEEIGNNILIYPNPTKGEGTITWKGPALNKIYDLQIYNNVGVLVYNTSPSPSSPSANFNLSNQLPGVYVARFILNTGQIVIKNILKW